MQTSNMAILAKNIARGVRLAKTPLGVGKGGSLTEAKGFKELVEGISDPIRQATTALMLESYRVYRSSLDESTSTLQIGSYDKWAFPLLTYVAENMIAQDLVSVQPMDGPNGQVFYMNFTTGQTKGNVPKGSKIWDARTAKVDRYQDSADTVNGEAFATSGDGLDGQSLAYIPVQPGTVAIVIDPSGSADLFTDDGNGQIINSANAVVGAIDYTTGVFSGATGTLAAVDADTQAEVSYQYNSELNDTAQQVDFEIQGAPIVARERKFRSRWTQEAALSMKALFEEDAENLVSTAITSAIKWEIDREILEDLRKKAAAGVVTWSGNAPSNVGYVEHKLTMTDALMAGSNYIHRATNLARANWLVTGTSGSNVVETLPNFEPNTNLVEFEGVAEVGRIGTMKTYVDPHFPVNEMLLGYKGNDLVRTGYIFAPWVLLYTTPTVMLDDFINRKGMASMYGKRMVNPKLYSRLVITNPQTSFGA